MAATAEPDSSQEPGCVETIRKFGLGRGLRNFEAGGDGRVFSDHAAGVDVFHGLKTLRPHRRAGANEVVQRQDERGEARARGRIALETAENKLIEAGRYGAPVMPRAHRRLVKLRMRVGWCSLRVKELTGVLRVKWNA